MIIKKLLRDAGFPIARTISYSKSEYRDNNPSSVVYYDASIVTISDGFVWLGDLDLTKDAEALKSVANELGEPLYVFKGSDSSHMIEGKQYPTFIPKAVWDTTRPTPFKIINLVD